MGQPFIISDGTTNGTTIYNGINDPMMFVQSITISVDMNESVVKATGKRFVLATEDEVKTEPTVATLQENPQTKELFETPTRLKLGADGELLLEDFELENLRLGPPPGWGIPHPTVYAPCGKCIDVCRGHTDEERIEIHQECLDSGLSENEARATAWPEEA